MRRFLVSALLSLVAVLPAYAQAASRATTLFYTHPAREWNQALPLGNGRLGAMVFGNVIAERIQLNENSLWMGGPRDTNNPDALKHLAEVRRLLFAGMPVEAYAVAEKYSMGSPFRLESYQSLGDLRLTFEHEGTPADYRFELDIDSAIARLSYRLGDVRYTREVFASYPAQAIVMRVSADAPGKITVSAWIDRPQDATTEVAGNDRLEPRRCARRRERAVISRVREDSCRRRKARGLSRAHLRGARECRHVRGRRGDELSRNRPSRGGGAGAVGRRGNAVRAAEGGSRRRSSEAVPPRRAARSGPHHDAIRCASMPTDERLERVKKGESDLGLEALYFQFGRYLLIASSRPGGLPANLQGLWNDSMFPPWDSDYHLNINLQMNYWPAEVTNLAELHQPLFDYLESLREPGRKTARVHYGANGLRRASHQRHLGFHDAGRSSALRALAYRRGVADPAFVGALSVQSRPRVSREGVSGHERGGGVFPRLPRRGSARARAARQRPVGVA